MYQDSDGFHFMNMESYDQVALPADIIGDQAAYLQPEMEVTISMHEGVPVAIELPPKAVLEVVETEPTIKSQTAASSYKPAVLSNGVRTMVPPFVTTGTKIVVMTADGSYVERAKVVDRKPLVRARPRESGHTGRFPAQLAGLPASARMSGTTAAQPAFRNDAAQKNASVRISMLSRGRALGGEVGSSKAVCAVQRARPSLSESYTLNTIASSRRMRGNQNHLWFGL